MSIANILNSIGGGVQGYMQGVKEREERAIGKEQLTRSNRLADLRELILREDMKRKAAEEERLSGPALIPTSKTTWGLENAGNIEPSGYGDAPAGDQTWQKPVSQTSFGTTPISGLTMREAEKYGLKNIMELLKPKGEGEAKGASWGTYNPVTGQPIWQKPQGKTKPIYVQGHGLWDPDTKTIILPEKPGFDLRETEQGWTYFQRPSGEIPTTSTPPGVPTQTGPTPAPSGGLGSVLQGVLSGAIPGNEPMGKETDVSLPDVIESLPQTPPQPVPTPTPPSTSLPTGLGTVKSYPTGLKGKATTGLASLNEYRKIPGNENKTYEDFKKWEAQIKQKAREPNFKEKALQNIWQGLTSEEKKKALGALPGDKDVGEKDILNIYSNIMTTPDVRKAIQPVAEAIIRRATEKKIPTISGKLPEGVPPGSTLLPQKSKRGNPVYKATDGKLYEVTP